MREQLEQNILDNPHDDAPRLIYADWLEENDENDRAEFIRTQIALEDENLSTVDRQTLAQRETELLEKYQRQWLGKLAPFLLDNEDDIRYDRAGNNCEFRFHRGFFEELQIGTLGFHLVNAIIQAPEMQWVQRFCVEFQTTEHEYQYRVDTKGDSSLLEGLPKKFNTEELLLLCPYLRNVRYLRIGENWDEETGWTDSWCYWETVPKLVAKMPKLEELHLFCKDYDPEELFSLTTLPELRVLWSFHLGGMFRDYQAETGYVYPLEILANNTNFQNLETIRFHPHQSRESEYPEPGNYHNYRHLSYLPLDQVRYLLETPNLPKLRHLQLRLSDMGDEGCEAIAESGILKRLKILDLRHGAITDEGAKLLAECPDLRNLERLDVNRNGLTQGGLELLRSTGITVLGDDQQTPEELEGRQYLTEGDFE
ncbi:MAG: TIGR02996 domain-containing protein [Gemmataceae bacterium]